MTRDNDSMIRYCDRLTENGDKLSISWDGGNDSGYGELFLNEEKLDDSSPEAEEVINYLVDELGYGSFAGDFSTNGEAVYDRETKTFIGDDNYSTTDTDEKKCSIAIQIQCNVWFDSLRIQFETDCDKVSVIATLIILNGPRTEVHSELETQLQDHLTREIQSEIDEIENFAGMWDQFDILFREFSKKEDCLEYTIQSLEHSVDSYRHTEIEISLLDKIQQHESI